MVMLRAVKPAASALSRATQARTFASSTVNKDKVVAVLYPGGEFAKRQPKMLGSVENELGLREWIESQGHSLVVTADKDGPNSTFAREAVDANIIITTPFHPAYVTADVIEKAKDLKACITAGVGSDHVDLDAANKRKIGVYEVTGSNVTSVAEHAVMTILVLVRNFVAAHNQYVNGKWDVAEVAMNSYDIEGKVVGTLGIGRIGRRILERLKPFDCKELLYHDYNKLDDATEKEIGCSRVEDLGDFVSRCDVITINAPLHAGTQGLFNKELISKMKPGAWIVNTARGAIANKDDIAKALEDGQLNGYGGDVSFPQPPPADHPWHHMRNIWNPDLGGGNAMTPHISGTSLDAQARYVAGTKDILERFWNKKTQTEANIIVENGNYVSRSYGQR
ncbi:formate dehydrogenase [Malassezia obtusa]|uniref:Formate dehydrogenase n=1 Tax=Malassezia obtusa TaxID=76774 RepID=A0AAF0DVZ4_9BASI|nr:formate dehydrogenase [Malassezia obtusa]